MDYNLFMNGQTAGAIIVAAGESRRMNGRDKILAKIGGKTVLEYTLAAFLGCPGIDRVVLVLNRKHLAIVRGLIEKFPGIKTCSGGRRRQDSVAAGLNELGPCDWVVVHDGARPLVTSDMILAGLAAAVETGAAIAAVPVRDTIKLAEGEFIKETVPRQDLRAAQTPQVFRHDILQRAYLQAEGDATDDAALVELTGIKVKLFPGSYRNIKITSPEDLLIAESLLKDGS